MLSVSHLIIMIIAALIFLGPNKIPQFLKSCGEGIVAFKDIINKSSINNDIKNNNNSTYHKNKNNHKNKKNRKNKQHFIKNKQKNFYKKKS